MEYSDKVKPAEDIEQVIHAIDAADPEQEDDVMQAMRDALRFARGWEGTAAEFISMYVTEG